MIVPHVLSLIWEVVYVTAIVVGLAFLTRDQLQRRAHRRAAMEGLHAANDNHRDWRRARR